MNRLLSSISAFMREWRRCAWLKARRDAIKDPFTN
jgi:hypothetical protein